MTPDTEALVKALERIEQESGDPDIAGTTGRAAAKIAEQAREIERLGGLADGYGKLDADYATLEAKLAERDAELARAHDNFIKAWEALPGCRYYSVETMQKWIMDDMKPAVDRARAARKFMEDTDGRT